MHDSGHSFDSGSSSHSSGSSSYSGHASHGSYEPGWVPAGQYYAANSADPNSYYYDSSGRGGRRGFGPLGLILLVLAIFLPILLMVIIPLL